MNLKKISDTIMSNRVVVLSNTNDLTNLINEMCPSISDEQFSDLMDTIENSDIDKFEKVNVLLSSVPLNEAKLNYRLDDWYLCFK